MLDTSENGTWNTVVHTDGTWNTVVHAGEVQKQCPVGGQGAKPLKLKAFSKSKVRKNPFPGTLSCFKQPLTKYSLLCLKISSRGTNKPVSLVGVKEQCP